jgi:hypothetical protein
VVWRRDKMGWAIPEAAWFSGTGPLAPWLQAQLKSSAYARDAAAAAGIDIQHAPLKQNLRLLNLARWHRMYFEESGQPGRKLGRGMPLGRAGTDGVSTSSSTTKGTGTGTGTGRGRGRGRGTGASHGAAT